MSIRFIGGYVAIVALLLYVWTTLPEKNPLFAVSLLGALAAMVALNLWIRVSARRAENARKAARADRKPVPSGD
ncbi:hypothetical protein F5X71_30015 [Nocardia brasiliensis]|uniref:Uncharacterized protein n=1 Tax=Nocardia brasiliensis TaxID=37326 RepID=A0A6G9XYI9_NOCBR|nr:hypothetical protein [Nocardia brasiliensis]QIS05984.1 hypothetical protein F5X71_30015 [Nocardia brasiliensis]